MVTHKKNYVAALSNGCDLQVNPAYAKHSCTNLDSEEALYDEPAAANIKLELKEENDYYYYTRPQ